MHRSAPWMLLATTCLVLPVLGGVAPAQDLDKPRRTLSFEVDYQVKATGNTSTVKLIALVPQDLAHRQVVKSLKFDPEPRRIFQKAGERYVHWEIDKPKAPVTLKMTVTMELFRNDLVATRLRARDPEPRPWDSGHGSKTDGDNGRGTGGGQSGGNASSPGEGSGGGGGRTGRTGRTGRNGNLDGRRVEGVEPDAGFSGDPPDAGRLGGKELADYLAPYLAPEKFIECKHEKIQRAARKIRVPRGNTEKLLRGIHDLVIAEMRTGSYNPGEVGAVAALAAGTGDCTEYSDLFVALCRAKGVPARVVEGYTAPWHNVPQHNWVEVWLDDHGWVSFDPFRSEWPSTSFERLRNVYVVLCRTRNNETLNGYHFYWYTYTGDAIQVTSRFRPK